MVTRWIPLAASFALVMAGLSGCRCHTCNRCPPSCPTTVNAPPVVVPRAQYYQPQAAPCPGCDRSLPGTAVPPSAWGPPPAPPSVSAGPPPVVAERPSVGTWQPAPPSASDRRPSPGSDESNRARLNIPEPMDRPPPPPEDVDATRPPARDDLSVEIPQFEQVYDRVAAGLQPFPDGFQLLAAKGYRSVLHIRRDTEDASALRASVESKGMKYQDLVVSPATLNRETVDRFSRLIGETALQPIFVFDRKGQLAGALWYLHFRLNDGLPEQEARRRAVRLGLDEDPRGENAELWLAINRILRGV